MWGLILFVTVLCAAGIGYGVMEDGIRRSRQRRRDWEKAAASCGLQILAVETPSWTPQLKAQAGPVVAWIDPSGDAGEFTRIMVKAPGPPDFHLVKIHPESVFPGEREIEIGHKSFDSTFAIQGPIQLVFALLDAETRRQMLRVGTTKLEISNGALQVEVSDELVSFILPRLLNLCQRFAPLMDVPRRLAENARQDPEDGVRLRNLLLLAREHPGEPGTLEALRAACSDPSPGIRLRAARELGAEGRSVLLEIAELMVHDDLSAEAVSALDGKLPFERARFILQIALRLRNLQTTRACLKALVHSGGAAAVEELATVMEREKGGLATAAAQALGETGSPAAEPPLIRALRHEQTDVRVAAAIALGRVGSVAAVLPLKEVESSWLDRELRRATRQAVAEIQSRLQGAAPGQLSLAAAEAGQLSLAQTEAGQLSLAPKPAGQLPVTPEGRSL